MSGDVNKIVIAGAGQAGAAVALGLRRAGFDGEIVMVGEEFHPPYERPQLSKEMLQLERVDLRVIKSLPDYKEHNIELILGSKMVKVDADARSIFLSSGKEIKFDQLVIATGVSPRRLPDPLRGLERVHYLRTAEDSNNLRSDLELGKPIAIVGGGVIGLEVAAAARSFGCHVTLIEAADRLMSRSIDETVSRYLERAHRREGVDFRFGVHATELSSNGFLKLSDGSSIPAQSVLAGIGVTPNVDGLEDLGITDSLGVRVDAFGQTSVAGIYATGDVASQPNGSRFRRVETWSNAQDHALNVVKNILGKSVPHESPVWFWSDQGRINLQVFGNAIEGERVIRGDEHGNAFSVFWLDDDYRVAGCSAINSPKDGAVARRWIKKGSQVDRQRLADKNIPLRDCAV